MCFFKQRTAYEMRISDWSSDVCSSDLIDGPEGDQPYRALQQNEQTAEAECQGERPQQAGTQLGAVAGAVGLGGEAGRAHAQKAEAPERSEEHTSELQSLMRISYAVFCLKKKKKTQHIQKRSNTKRA